MFNRKTESRAGFTLIEILLSLAILGLLMAAVAVAFNASVVNYTTNENMFQAMSTARQAIMRITSDLRTASAVSTTEPSNQCSMVTSDNRDITYQFNSASNILYLVVNSGANAGSYVLCRNVSAMTFNRTTVPGDPTKIRNVRISMTVTVAGASQTVASAAVIRRNMGS